MKIDKTKSINIIKDYNELKFFILDKPPVAISNKFYRISTIEDCLELVNNETNTDLGIDIFQIGIEKCNIKLLDNSIKHYNIIGAKNIFTALLLEGCLNINIKVDKKTIDEIISTFQHEKFVHVPESMHFLSGEVVYEDKDYYVVFIKDTKMFKAFKI